MEMIDNISKTLKDDLVKELKKGSKLSIAASYFSIYAYEALKKELNKIEELRFLFTSPTFVQNEIDEESKEFYIPRLNREKSLYGTEFELKLKKELNQKSIAKECSEWIRKKVKFKSNITNEIIYPFINLDNVTYNQINGFTCSDLGCERSNNAYTLINKFVNENSQAYLNIFNSLWNNEEKFKDITEKVIESINTVCKENSPEFIYFVTIYNIFNEFLEDISEGSLPNEATGFKESKVWNMLYNFQKDAVLGIINKLEKYNGCILADSVGLGKTFTSLAVIKYYENKNKSVLVLCPKKLSNNWNTYKGNYVNNPIAADRLRYDVLYHTDLNRVKGKSNGIDLGSLNWGNYDLVVIDESHNFRNGGNISGKDEKKENRYLKLLNKIIKVGIKTKVLMLSATPVNNRFNDLKNQLSLIYEGEAGTIDKKLSTNKSIDEIFRIAQRAFNKWSEIEEIEERTTENLLKTLDFDFFEVLDSLTIARSRKHIQKYYDTVDIGKFPIRLKPISLRPKLSNLKEVISYNEIFEQLMLLSLTIYTPTQYILPSKMDKYSQKYHDNTINIGFTQANREQGIRRLMVINLMKRMESSVHSFKLTLKRINKLIDDTINIISKYDEYSKETYEFRDISYVNELDDDDLNNDNIFSFGKKVKINISDMDYKSWKKDLEKDKEILDLLVIMIEDVTPEYDSKLQELLKIIQEKIKNPINKENKKIIIFTAFADTAEYLYENVSEYVKSKFNINSALVTGSVDGKTNIKLKNKDLNTVLTCFSPISKNKKLLMSDIDVDIDLLIATDCISEGQNLQDCDYLINYDIHWNPVRIIQRFGRIDRIGSKNECIQLVNFWPDVTLDEYINLKTRVETRMKILDMTATGDDNILSDEEDSDLEYRKLQLKRLQEEVVDIEDMSSGISITDLGLNEFKLDLINIKNHKEFEKVPLGLHSVVNSMNPDVPEGVIYILKNKSKELNIKNSNRLHPFYMVYVDNEGEIVCDYLSPKQLLDKMRFICKGKSDPIPEVYRIFNEETDDGRNMEELSHLLKKGIHSIIETKEESDLDSFFNGNQVSFLKNDFKGLDDFELICFLVIKKSTEN